VSLELSNLTRILPRTVWKTL